MKKTILIIAVIIILSLPIFKYDYYNGEYMEVRNYSIITGLIADIKDGTLGTGL